jgi:hypothetical protein
MAGKQGCKVAISESTGTGVRGLVVTEAVPAGGVVLIEEAMCTAESEEGLAKWALTRKILSGGACGLDEGCH